MTFREKGLFRWEVGDSVGRRTVRERGKVFGKWLPSVKFPEHEQLLTFLLKKGPAKNGRIPLRAHTRPTVTISSRLWVVGRLVGCTSAGRNDDNYRQSLSLSSPTVVGRKFVTLPLLFPYSVENGNMWRGRKCSCCLLLREERESGFSVFDIAEKTRTAGKILFLLPFSLSVWEPWVWEEGPPLLFSPPEPDFGTLDRY